MGQQPNRVEKSGHSWDTRGTDELVESMRRLEAANILLAVSEDGYLRIVQTDADTQKAIRDGLTIYSPRDAYVYMTLSQSERRMLHSFKKRFGGTTGWKLSQ
jgi:hypothetical protein